METKHSLKNLPTAKDNVDGRCQIIDTSDGEIQVWGYNREANAAHIVRCVNSHDELVARTECNKSTLMDILCRAELPKDVVDDILGEIEWNDAALRKARGEA